VVKDFEEAMHFIVEIKFFIFHSRFYH